MNLKAIVTTVDYADEFDYPIISIIPERLWRVLTLHSSSFDELEGLDYLGFGTNQGLSLDPGTLKSMVDNAIDITEDQATILKKIQYASVDIIEDIMDYIYDKADEVPGFAEIKRVNDEIEGTT